MGIPSSIDVVGLCIVKILNHRGGGAAPTRCEKKKGERGKEGQKLDSDLLWNDFCIAPGRRSYGGSLLHRNDVLFWKGRKLESAGGLAAFLDQAMDHLFFCQTA